jgi:hypothetical protein
VNFIVHGLQMAPPLLKEVGSGCPGLWLDQGCQPDIHHITYTLVIQQSNRIAKPAAVDSTMNIVGAF